MTTSKKTPLLSELESSDPLSPGVLAYLARRVRNSHFQYLLKKFDEAERGQGLTKSKLAERIGQRRDRISRLLSSPGNLTLDTYTHLLVGIAGEEPIPCSEPILERGTRNMQQADLIGTATSTTSSSTTIVDVCIGDSRLRAVPGPTETTSSPIKTIFIEAQ